jgi:hypothetical protein
MTTPKCRPSELIIDASDITVTDINPSEIQKLEKPHDGYGKAVANLAALKPEDIQHAGLNAKDIQRVLRLQKTDDRIGELLPDAERIVEMLNEARLVRRHQIATLLTELAAQARSRANIAVNSAEVLRVLADLIEYSSSPASLPPPTRKEKADAAK